MFISGLITPNDEENKFSADGYDSPKQLYLMWTLQLAKSQEENNWRDHSSVTAVPELREQEKVLIMELEA